MWPFGFGNRYPYTDFHELNLDWILDKIRGLESSMQHFIVDTKDTIISTVNKWLDDHPEATTTVQDGAITIAKLNQETVELIDEKLVKPKINGDYGNTIQYVENNKTVWSNLPVSTISIGRYGRILDRFGYSGTNRVLECQSAVEYNGHYFCCGDNLAGDAQSISEWDSNGLLVQSKTDYTQLGHANSITALDGRLYVADGADPYIHIVNISNLSFIRSITINDMVTVYAICEYDGDIYFAGYENVSSTQTIIGKLIGDQGGYETVCAFDDVNNKVRQGMAVYGQYAYMVYNRNTQIIKVRLEDGKIIGIYDIPNGDSINPAGEPEDLFIHDGKLCLVSAPYYQDKVWTSEYMAMLQLFNTDLLGPLDKNEQYSYTYKQASLNLTVDGSGAYAFNPDMNYTTIEEACYILNYLGYGSISASNINTGYLALQEGTYTLYGSTGNRSVNEMQLKNVSLISNAITALKFSARNSRARILASLGFTQVECTRSEISFDYVSFADCTAFTNVRSKYSLTDVSGINDNIAITSSGADAYCTSLSYFTRYKKNAIKLGLVSNSPVILTIYVQGAPATCLIDASEITAGSFEHTAYGNPAVQTIKLAAGELTYKNISDAYVTCNDVLCKMETSAY